MARCALDKSIARKEIEGFSFPLGVYPIEAMTPKPGFAVNFEAADGDNNSGDWEEWPDRYAFEAVVSADRLETMCRMLFSLLPPRIFPILDVIGHDAYREIDPYISYDLCGLDRYLEAIARFRPWLFEDGLCGFGAMCDDPFFYMFLDEHKILTIRAVPEMRERVERVLRAFDLEEIESPAGADAAAHEHRGVLLAPESRPDLFSADEIIERLRDEWRLVLNVDAESNVDEDGNDLGSTAWRCLVRTLIAVPKREEGVLRYAEVLLHADCIAQAEALSKEASVKELGADAAVTFEPSVITADRVLPKQLRTLLGGKRGAIKSTPGTVHRVRWLN
jgi:hypothetical protein